VHARAVATRSRRDASAELAQADELQSKGQVEAARAAYERAMESGMPEQAARAASSLGTLLAEQGDVVGARAAFEQAIDSGQREWAPHAAVELGRLLVGQGDVEGAKAAFHVATRSDHYDCAARARRHLLELSPGPRRR
jgi:predicted negative regulator of RcsB-dependent stress response